MPRQPKPVYATIDDLQTAEHELNDKIDCLKPLLATKVDLDTARAKLEQDHAKLSEQVDFNKETTDESIRRVANDSKAYTDEVAENTMDEMKKLLSMLRTDITLVTDKLDDRITETDEKIREDMASELATLCENVDAQFASLKEELTELIEQRAREAAHNLTQSRNGVDANMDNVRLQAQSDRTKIRQEMADTIAKMQSDLDTRHEKTEAANGKTHADLHTRCDEILALANEHRTMVIEENMDIRNWANSALSAYRSATDRHLANIDEEARRMNDQILRTQGFATRRMEWSLKNAATLCRPPAPDSGKPYSNWFSPKFHAGGAEDFQLEFRVYPNSNGVALATSAQASSSGIVDLDEDEAVVAKPPSGVGDCALFLWSAASTSVAARLFVGDRAAVVEREYRERTAYGTKLLGFVMDQVKADDSLCLGVEILEVVRIMEVALPKKEAKLYGDKPCLPMSGTLSQHYHFNHRVLPLLRKEVERLQARLVRRVEWKMEQAASLPLRFAHLEPVCSPVFSAGGVDGMQFIFYPSGYSGATDSFCSLFLYAPAGVNMKFRLSMGTQVRDCHHDFGAGGAYGRTNYCRFEILPDPQEDTILVVLEIDDVTQELHSRLMSDDTKPLSKSANAANKGEADGVRTTMNLKRIPPKESLVDTRPLPSFWTTKALGDIYGPTDGFHAWEDLDAVAKKGKTSSGGGGGAGAGAGPSAAGHSRTAASLDLGSSATNPQKPSPPSPKSGNCHPSSPPNNSKGAAAAAAPGTAIWPKRYEPPSKGCPVSPSKQPPTISELAATSTTPGKVTRSSSSPGLPLLQPRQRQLGSSC